MKFKNPRLAISNTCFILFLCCVVIVCCCDGVCGVWWWLVVVGGLLSDCVGGNTLQWLLTNLEKFEIYVRQVPVAQNFVRWESVEQNFILHNLKFCATCRGGQKNRSLKKIEPNRWFFLIRFGFYFKKKPKYTVCKKNQNVGSVFGSLSWTEKPNYFFILFKSNMCYFSL